MAYQAASMPFKNHSTIYDYGSSASLWVSALEIMSHPRTANANLQSVLGLLAGYEWKDKVIGRKSYKLRYAGKNSGINLDTRKSYIKSFIVPQTSSFIHGDPVARKNLFPFRNTTGHPITKVCPTYLQGRPLWLSSAIPTKSNE